MARHSNLKIEASPVQGEVGFAKQSSEGLSARTVNLKILQNDRINNPSVTAKLRQLPLLGGAFLFALS